MFGPLVFLTLVLQDSLAFRVELPATAASGERVPIVLRLSNTARHPVTLALEGRPIAFDVTIARLDGTVVWRRLEGQVVSAILAVRTIEAGESLTFETEWSGGLPDGSPAPPGRYTVTGALPTDRPEGLNTKAAPLRVLAPGVAQPRLDG
jgi:hypothetical protein